MGSDDNCLAGDGPEEDGCEGPLILESAELMSGRREVWIRHGDEMYRLRLTSAGKLYLTK